MQKHLSIPVGVSVVCLALAGGPAGAQERLPDWFYKPIGKVGPLGPVDPLDPVAGDKRKSEEGVRPSGVNKYVACWTWDVSKEPKWRCTEKYGDYRDTLDFATYQAGRYENGYAGYWAVDPKDWDNPDLRKRLLDGFAKEKVPGALEAQAKKLEKDSAPDKAAALRKQIKFVQVEWVKVEPVLPKGVKVSDGVPTAKTKVRYDDEAIGVKSGVDPFTRSARVNRSKAGCGK